MNRDQVKGRMKEAAGTVQQKAGKATGNRTQQAKGIARRAVGAVQKTFGDTANESRKGRL